MARRPLRPPTGPARSYHARRGGASARWPAAARPDPVPRRRRHGQSVLTSRSGQFRRDKEHVKRRQALGVIAYAEAFQVTLARIRRPAGMQRHIIDDSLATFSFTQQRASIEVSKEVDS
jgi:hypothetical protein